MESAIKKLLEEYRRKISDEEIILEKIRLNNRDARHYGNEEEMRQLRLERVSALARMQAYVQAKADIDSLLDYT